MARNMEKIAENMKNKIPDRYTLSLFEYAYLADMAKGTGKDAAYDAVAMAFRYGFALGRRYQKNRQKRKRT